MYEMTRDDVSSIHVGSMRIAAGDYTYTSGSKGSVYAEMKHINGLNTIE